MTTARSIIVAALQLDGIIAANEAGDAADLDLGLSRLNGMLSSWSLNPSNILATVDETFPLVLNQGTYTIGVGGNFNTAVPISVLESSFIRYQSVDYPLKSITQDEFSQIPFKTNGGIPYCFFFDRNPTLSALTFYPLPQGSQTLYMKSVKPFTTFADLDTVYDLAPGYEEAMTYSLAERIASAFEREAPKFVVVEAVRLRKSLKRSNAVIPVQSVSHVPADLTQDPFDWRYQ